MKISQMEAEARILAALGLQDQCVLKLQITLEAAKPPAVVAVIQVKPERLGDLGIRLEEWTLAPIEEKNHASPIGQG